MPSTTDSAIDTPAQAWRTTAAHWGAFGARSDGKRILEVRPFHSDRNPSALLGSVIGAVHSDARIQQPCVRKGWLEGRERSDRTARGRDEFVPVGWDTALDLVAGELARVRATHSSSAVFNGSCGWASAGCFHHARNQLARFLNTGGGYTRHVTNFSFGAGMVILKRVLGTEQPLWGPSTSWKSIAEHTQLMVCFGGMPMKNVQVEAGGCAEHATPQWMHEMKRKGVRFICISPTSADMGGFLDAEWLAIKPGTDTALILALIHTLLVRGLQDTAFLASHSVGFERLARYVNGDDDGTPKSAQWAAPLCGIAAERIEALAVELASQRSFINLSWSLQRADFGEQPYWAAVSLAAALGQIGLPGGGIGFGYGSIARQGLPTGGIPVPRLDTGKNGVDIAIPAAKAADMLLHPGHTIPFDGTRITYPDIRLMYLCGGNPFHHHQHINKLLLGWRRVETVIVQDPWWTASARHADIVLPATTPYERNDIACGSLDRFLLAMPQLIAPVGQARNDHDIFAELCGRAGTRDAFTEGLDEMQWLRRMYDEHRRAAEAAHGPGPDFDTFWEQGWREFEPRGHDYVLFDAFRRDPTAAPLATPSGKIEIWSDAIARLGLANCRGHAAWFAPHDAPAPRGDMHTQGDISYPLHLISNQPASRLHSQLDCGSASGASKIAGREPIAINRADAAGRGIAQGDVVRVFNERGACLAGADLRDDLREGVAILATGAWYDPLLPGVIGSLDVHGNPNVLTDDRGSSDLAQGSSAQSTFVQIERWRAELPPVAVRRPPSMNTPLSTSGEA